MRKNDQFVAKIVNRRLTKICMAIFAHDERLPTSATLLLTNKFQIHTTRLPSTKWHMIQIMMRNKAKRNLHFLVQWYTSISQEDKGGSNILARDSNILEPKILVSIIWKGMKRESSDKTTFCVSPEGLPNGLGTFSLVWSDGDPV